MQNQEMCGYFMVYKKIQWLTRILKYLEVFSTCIIYLTDLADGDTASSELDTSITDEITQV